MNVENYWDLRSAFGEKAVYLQTVSTRFMKSRRPVAWETCLGIHCTLYMLDLLEI
jgi:uncharacterized membrane protein (UPF0136 family)